MAFTQKTDFTFKHVSQADSPVFATTALLKTALDSQAKELRDYINDTLLVELEAQGSAANIGVLASGVASKLQTFINTVEAAGTGTIPPDGSLTTAKFEAAAFSTDGTLADNSDTKISSQKAVKTYSDTKLPASYLDTDGALAANSDVKIASQKASKTYADTKIPATYLDTDGTLAANSDVKIASQKASKAYSDLMIPKSVVDAAGDLIVGTAADTVGRLAIGTTGQVPTVNAGATALEYKRNAIWEKVGAVNNSMGLLIQTNQDNMRFISLADYIYTMIPDGSTAVALARQTYAGVSTALSSLSFAAVSTTEHLAGFIQDDNDTDYLYVLTWNSVNYKYRCYRYSIVGNSWTTIGEYQTANGNYGIVGVGFDSANNYICITAQPGSNVLYRFNKSTFAMVAAITLTIPTAVAEGLAIYNGAKYIVPDQINKASLGFASNYATGGGTKTEKLHYATAEEVKLYPGSFTKKYLILYLESNRLMIIYDSVNDAIIKVLPCYVVHSKGACFTDGVYAYLANGTDIFRTPI